MYRSIAKGKKHRNKRREGLKTGEFSGRRVVKRELPKVDGRGADGIGDIVKSA